MVNVYIYICVHIYVYIHLYIYTYVYIYICICTCMSSSGTDFENSEIASPLRVITQPIWPEGMLAWSSALGKKPEEVLMIQILHDLICTIFQQLTGFWCDIQVIDRVVVLHSSN